MFNRPIHQKIFSILQALNAELLRECSAYFGGGTQLVLELGEYRQSHDIDFLCPYGPGYTLLRRALANSGYKVLFPHLTDLQFPRDIRADQYGIRFPVQVGDFLIRFEVVAEGRIAFDPPQQLDWCPVACLSRVDAIAEKLLANSDRGLDTSTFARDLIDLAMLRIQAPFSPAAVEKAEAVYPVLSPLQQALSRFQADPIFRDRCFGALQIQQSELILTGLQLLTADYLPDQSDDDD